jgi:hypothetical protein
MLASVAVAQKDKPWTEWTKKDIDKTLNDSAWGQTQLETDDTPAAGESAVTQVAAQRSADRQLSRSGESGQAKPVKYVKYSVRFLSAKPVRAAFARTVTLAKADADEVLTNQLQGFVDRDFSEYIVVSVGVEVGDPKMSVSIMKAFTEGCSRGLSKRA